MRKRFTLALLSLLLVPLSIMAQNVTIRANNGSTIAAIKNGGTTDSFFGAGGFATWQHSQLSMVLTVSDGTVLTSNGQLDNPANNLFTSGNYMQIGKGQKTGANTTYVSLSLPSGYRFTGYEIKFRKSTETKGSGNGAISFNSNVTGRFGETGSDFGTYTTSADVTNNNGSQTIKREGGITDMGNVLYFKLMNTTNSNTNGRVLITLESAEFYFTAEENYSPVTPAMEITSPVSAVDIPFSTSKVDYGPVQNRDYVINGRTYTRMSYSSADVTDLQAYLHLYEAESIKDGTDIDGISGKVVDYKAGSISSFGDYFKVGGVKDENNADKEQIYYIETPTYVTLSNGVKNPIGYRITKAEFDYTNSVAADDNSFYIVYTYNGTKYYLNTDGRFTTTPVVWQIDDDGYISSGGRYMYWNNNYVATQTTKPDYGERFTIASNGRIYQTYYTSYYIRFYEQNGTYFGMISPDTGEYATAEEVAGETLGTYTLKIYDKNGSNPETILVSGADKYTLSGLNNDAVKFGVIGTGFVRARLTMQALDPYLESMSVVCQDEVQTQVRLSQPFTASDFSVSGGEFYFYLPEDCAGHQVAITFEDLKSKYFDETYTGGSAEHTSRLNFVKSAHYNAFGNAHPNVIYTNRAEAASASPLERLKVGTVGSAPFKFNNADEVGASGGTLTEYPFSLQKYAEAPNNGTFGELKFTVSTDDQDETSYVFTTDETRYNIAPTTATQHRAYAFYEMIIHVQTQTYEPKVEFTKIYDETLYRDKDGNVQTGSFWGAKVTAYDGNTPPKPGYSSTSVIFDHIDKAIKRGTDDFGNSCEGLTDSHQLLYLDFSEMAGIYQTTTDTHGSMEAFAASNAANCLIFIPVGATAPNNNVAYKTQGGGFRAAQNIVLNDMQPFYSPYDIQVEEAKQAIYQRGITKDSYGNAQHFSIIMPYQLKVVNGIHTNVDGTTFTVHSMQQTNAIALDNGSTYAYMPALSKVTATTPNMPYFIQMPDKVEENTITITQNGTLIKATKTAAADETLGTQTVTYNDNYTLTGPSAKGDVTDGTAKGEYTFTPTGTYAGIAVPMEDKIFYFANNEFVNSVDYKYAGGKIKFAPFRAYLATTGSRMTPIIHNMEVVFGENPNSETDGIDMLAVPVEVDMNAPVFDLQGRKMADGLKDAHLAKGIYVINGVKVIVK